MKNNLDVFCDRTYQCLGFDLQVKRDCYYNLLEIRQSFHGTYSLCCHPKFVEIGRLLDELITEFHSDFVLAQKKFTDYAVEKRNELDNNIVKGK